ncbi:MAG: proteasome accessory factor PafA2 family protein [Candidatus Glassbacteria bacterium]
MKKKLLPKLAGIETEYAIIMRESEKVYRFGNASSRATKLVLNHCEAFPGGYRWGCDFLSNGGRLYHDHCHVEYSTPESLSARQLVAAVKAGDSVVNRARVRANESLPKEEKILIFANNSDGFGNSYAGHLNLLLSREAFDHLFKKRPHALYMYWVPYLVSAQVYTGAGKVGSENCDTAVRFQISQRADFIETAAIGEQTTICRPIINSRDEALADRDRFARLHIITFDTNMAEYALWLKVGTAQLVLGMLEANYSIVNLTLRDPVTSMKVISRDPSLKKKVRLEDGRMLSALDIQEQILLAASRFVEKGYAGEVVPEAADIIESWTDTLVKLRNNTGELFGSIDWITKLSLLSLYRRKKGLSWNHPSMKELDHQYHNIDPETGLYFTGLLNGNLVRRVTSDDEIRFMEDNAPENTRAYFRAQCLNRFADHIIGVNWNTIRFSRNDGYFSPITASLCLDDPLGFTKEEVDTLLCRVSSVTDLFDLSISEIEDRTSATTYFFLT